MRNNNNVITTTPFRALVGLSIKGNVDLATIIGELMSKNGSIQKSLESRGATFALPAPKVAIASSHKVEKNAGKNSIFGSIMKKYSDNYKLLNGELLDSVPVGVGGMLPDKETPPFNFNFSFLDEVANGELDGQNEEVPFKKSAPRVLDKDVMSAIEKGLASSAKFLGLDIEYTIVEQIVGARMDYIEIYIDNVKARNVLPTGAKLDVVLREISNLLKPKDGSNPKPNTLSMSSVRRASDGGDKRAISLVQTDNTIYISIEKRKPTMLLNSEIAIEDLEGLEFFAEVRGEPLVFTFGSTDLPHMVMGGVTGAGKSVAVLAMVQRWTWQNTTRELTYDLISPKNDEDNPMKDLRKFSDSPLLMGDVLTQTGTRQEFLTSVLKVCNIYEGYMIPVGANGHIPSPSIKKVLVIDEIAMVLTPYDKPTEDQKELNQIIAKIAEALDNIGRQGRSWGVHLLLATQAPTKKLLDTLKNHMTIFALKVTDTGVATSMGYRQKGEVQATDLAGHGDGLLNYRSVIYRVQMPMYV